MYIKTAPIFKKKNRPGGSNAGKQLAQSENAVVTKYGENNVMTLLFIQVLLSWSRVASVCSTKRGCLALRSVSVLGAELRHLRSFDFLLLLVVRVADVTD